MDYMKFVEHHRNTDADITIGCLPVDQERATDFGLMKINDEGQILVRFQAIIAYSKRAVLLAIWLYKSSLHIQQVAKLVSGVSHAWSGLQDFAEKPKGEALEKMKVDTTILGKSFTCQSDFQHWHSDF